MKTTIEVKGYQIVIEETENEISVTAIKDDETMEEFTLNLGEESEGSGEEKSDDNDIKSFDEFGDEEDDFEGSEEKEGEESDDDDDDDEYDDEYEDDDEPVEQKSKDEPALESFQSFINRRRK